MEAVSIKKIRSLLFLLLYGLLLGIHDGYVALYQHGISHPVDIFPRHVTMLPDADRQALERGIPVADDEMLQHLLEDYLS